MDSVDKTSVTAAADASFDNIIGRGIDDLNASTCFQETSLRQEEIITKSKHPVFHSWWFKTLVVVYVILTAAYIILDQTTPNMLTADEADIQMRQFLQAMEVPEQDWKLPADESEKSK